MGHYHMLVSHYKGRVHVFVAESGQLQRNASTKYARLPVSHLTMIEGWPWGIARLVPICFQRLLCGAVLKGSYASLLIHRNALVP